ncbi:TPR transcriptional regulator Cro-CI family [Furfurilactobacillus rossiae]|uniref:helix-turn-helix domain-containing protein n=1 Tax=Furfurilactobacillus rossiae TaxID=231049 RepID=UPI0015BE370E|nr:helix-turn-helix transcriptional regulator [Furfurilactobacillus rossiae]MCF6166315.1 helix-turn-helix domain-containing protein [Furfurilactobacillus rossiae]QLE65118.1 TPR transcriptional regulator Cro-CI family [Furfurilactobacillus rossiae]
MINKNLFKQLRTKNGYTQRSLAQGITTQGTISQIEKNAVEPSRKILTALAEKLNVQPDSLIDVSQRPSILTDLRSADTLYKNYQYQEVLNLLSPYENQNYDINSIQLHLIFLLTASRVWLHQDYDEGIFGFNRILQDPNFSIYSILATVELAIVYYKKENFSRAEFYADSVSKMLEKLEENGKVSEPAWYAIIMENMAKYYLRTGDYEQSVKYSNTIISFLNSINSSYDIDSAYLTLASAVSKIDGDNDVAKGYLLQAWAFAKNSKNKQVLSNVLREIKRLNIKVYQ